MPHQIASATGCSLEEALAVLLLLFRLSVAEAFLLVYHNIHEGDTPPILARGILDGLPQVPFVCEICQEEIASSSELSYDFLFKITENVCFIGLTQDKVVDD